MQALQIFRVVPKLPQRLEPLWSIATNLWFSWSSELATIFATIDHNLWTACEQNPIALLNRLPQRRIEELAHDDFFIQRLGEAKRALDHYLERRHSPFKFPALPENGVAVAYFSLEYGIATCLPSIPEGWASSPATTSKARATSTCRSWASACSTARATSGST